MISFDIVKKGSGLILPDEAYLDGFSVIRDYAKIEVHYHDELIMKADFNEEKIYLVDHGEFIVKERFSPRVDLCAINASGQELFVCYVDYERKNKKFRYSDMNIVSPSGRFDDFFLREDNLDFFKLFKPHAMTVMFRENQKDIKVMLCVAIYIWLMRDMSRHDG